MRKGISILLIFFFAAIVALLATLGWQPTVAALRQIVYPIKFTDGLVGYWPFNGADITGTTATDRSGSGLNGTIAGTPKRRSGVVGQALDFDGTDNAVTVSNNAAINPASISVEFWMMANKEVNFQSPLTKTTSGSWNDGYGFYNRSSNSTFEWWVNAYSGIPTNPAYVIATMPSLGQWHHVVGTYDGATVTLYIDGAVSGTPFSFAVGITHSATDLVIGLPPSGAYWDGAIDEVRIYNRALSAAEVALHYKNTAHAEGSKQNISQNNRFDGGLVGFWPFNGPDVSGTTATDRSGQGNNGTLTNGPIVTPGVVGQAVKFDGSNDYITISNPSIDDFGTGPMTVTTWFKTGQLGYQTPIDNKTAGTNNAGFNLYINTSDNDMIFRVANGAAQALAGNSGRVVTDNQWHHAVGVRDGDTITLYIDGVQDGTATGVSTWNITSAQAILIGAYDTAGGGSWNGQIDEIRLYNRALSATEIAEQYRAGAPTERSKQNVNQNNRFNDGLVGFWPFNGPDVSGTTATDRSGSGNNGTIVGGPTTVSGVVGQALNFDNTNDEITAGATGLTGDLTASWSAWIKTNSVITSDLQTIATIGDTAVALNTFGLLLNVGGSGVVSLEYAGSNGCATAAGVITTNTWYHLVGTKTAGAINTTSKIYVNGVEVACTGSASTPSVATGGTTIGDFVNAGYQFDGLIDEVRIYNRALSAAEVAEIYRAGKRE